ncbi:MAG: septation regulator SpoVG [Clostridia bacterium]|nr:septation regulator SpoVG [Clostridia bacterium]
MEITDIRVRKIDSNSKMKAIVSITIDNEFVVHDIKVIESPTRLFIAMPSRQNKEGEYKDIAHPINSETREKLQTAILEAYDKALKEEPAAETAEEE